MTHYLIIGNGVAGTTAAENIRKLDKTGKITVVTEEATPFYYRMRLPDFISGDLTEDKLNGKKDQWYKDQGIDLRLNTRIQGASLEKKEVTTQGNQEISFDRLLIATGSRSFIPPMKGADKKGVFALRSLQDARNIVAWARNIQKVVLIGGGWLGLEEIGRACGG